MTTDDMVRELSEAAEFENTECGEYWKGLEQMWNVIQYGASCQFLVAFKEEVELTYKWFKDNFTWVEHEEIKCECCGKGRPAYRELVFNDDNWG